MSIFEYFFGKEKQFKRRLWKKYFVLYRNETQLYIWEAGGLGDLPIRFFSMHISIPDIRGRRGHSNEKFNFRTFYFKLKRIEGVWVNFWVVWRGKSVPKQAVIQSIFGADK